MRIFQCAYTLGFPSRVQSSGDFSSYVLLCLPSLLAFPPPYHISNPFVLQTNFLTDFLPTYSVVATLENLSYVTLAIKIDFYSQLLGNGPSMTNTNFRNFFRFDFFFFFLSSQNEPCKEVLQLWWEDFCLTHSPSKCLIPWTPSVTIVNWWHSRCGN